MQNLELSDAEAPALIAAGQGPVSGTPLEIHPLVGVAPALFSQFETASVQCRTAPIDNEAAI
jgi:hypothetical protein